MKVRLTLVDREANDNHIDTKLAEHLYAPVRCDREMDFQQIIC